MNFCSTYIFVEVLRILVYKVSDVTIRLKKSPLITYVCKVQRNVKFGVYAFCKWLIGSRSELDVRLLQVQICLGRSSHTTY